MYTSNLVTIVASSVRRAQCRYCGAPILWATTARERDRPSRNVPFDVPRPFPLSVSRNDETGVTFENWPRGARHWYTCQGPRPAVWRPARREV